MISDTAFLQKSAHHGRLPGGRHPNDVRALAITPDKTVWLGTAHGLFTLEDDGFERVEDANIGYPDIKCLTVDTDGTLWVGAGLGLASRSSSGDWTIHMEDSWDEGAFTAVTRFSDTLLVATSSRGLARVVDGHLAPVSDLYPADKQIYGLKHRIGSVMILGEAGAVTARPDLTAVKRHALESLQIRDVMFDGSITYYATSDGLFKQDGESEPRHIETPIRDIHSVTRTRLGNTCASSSGIFIHGERWHYLAGQRWLPSDDTRAVVQLDDTIIVATGNGCGRIQLQAHTLEEKEKGFQERIRDRHLRLKGYVTTSHLDTPGDLSTNRPAPSDNDGLWTALYLAAQSYRYAVTGSHEARQWANQAYDAIEWLEGVTTVDGFPTKAIVEKGGDTGSDAVPWYPSENGEWLWKGDCSSDEIDGHMYGYAIFYDLAADKTFKARLVALVDRIVGHIIDNDYLIIGKDGKQTRWGVWSPEYLNGPWRAQRGLNSLEILSALKTAHHITRNPRYDDCYRDLIENHGYAENARHVKLTLPGHVNHSDDELAFISYYPLLKYETDPELRAIYLESLTHSWETERPERNPWWNFIYGALTEQPCDADLAVKTLQEIPTDLIDWPIRNSHRRDVRLDAIRGRKGELQSVDVLPYDELPAHKWNFNPYSLDSSTHGTREEDGTHYLLPYWMGRYYGYIGESTS
jgi:hypothetical protein